MLGGGGHGWNRERGQIWGIGQIFIWSWSGDSKIRDCPPCIVRVKLYVFRYDPDPDLRSLEHELNIQPVGWDLRPDWVRAFLECQLTRVVLLPNYRTLFLVSFLTACPPAHLARTLHTAASNPCAIG